MKKISIFILLVAFIVSACGTVVHSSKQNIAFNSDPQGVKVKVATHECKTPCILTVPRKADRFTIEKDGKEKTFEFEKSFNGWSVILGNILWLVPGIVVDFITGAVYTIDSANVNINSTKVVVDAKGRPE